MLSGCYSSQESGTRAGWWSGGLLQQLPEDIALLVHGFASSISLGSIDIDRLVADDAIVFCLNSTGHTVPRFHGTSFSGNGTPWTAS